MRLTDMSSTSIIDMFPGTRSSLISEALDKAVAGGAENVPGGHSAYLSLADWLAKEHGYRTTVTSAQGETEYVLSTTHYFFVRPVESTIRVQADNHVFLKKRS